MRRRAAHHADIGVHGDHWKLYSLKYALIGVKDALIRSIKVLRRRAGAVGVLHGELAQTDQAATRPRLVAELGLYLVEEER